MDFDHTLILNCYVSQMEIRWQRKIRWQLIQYVRSFRFHIAELWSTANKADDIIDVSCNHSNYCSWFVTDLFRRDKAETRHAFEGTRQPSTSRQWRRLLRFSPCRRSRLQHRRLLLWICRGRRQRLPTTTPCLPRHRQVRRRYIAHNIGRPSIKRL